MNAFKSFAASLLLALMVCAPALASEMVNINTADAGTLARVLSNVGPAKAEEIINYRREHGAFKSVEELALVKGIGLRTVELNRDRIELGNAPLRRPASAVATISTQ